MKDLLSSVKTGIVAHVLDEITCSEFQSPFKVLLNLRIVNERRGRAIFNHAKTDIGGAHINSSLRRKEHWIDVLVSLVVQILSCLDKVLENRGSIDLLFDIS
jgi:hypothetical protein